MFLHLSVSHSVHMGVCLSACWDTTPPGAGNPSGPGTPPPTGTRHPQDQAPPRAGTPLGPGTPRSRRLLLRTVPILLECIHVNQKRSRSTIMLFLKLEFLTWHDKISFAIKFPDNAAVDIFWCGFDKSTRLSKCCFVVVEVKFIEKIMHKIIIYDPNNSRVFQQIRQPPHLKIDIKFLDSWRILLIVFWFDLC